VSITNLIALITIGVSIAAFNNLQLLYRLQFNAWQIYHRKENWRFISHALVHADWMHLLFNMFTFYVFGNAVERYFYYYFNEKGFLYFCLLYVGSIAFASLPSFKKHKNNQWFNSVGASGGVSAIIFSYIIFEPLNAICLYGLLCLPGIVWGVAYLVYSWYAAKNQSDIINHDAHFAGALFGVFFTILIKPSLGVFFVDKILAYFN